MEGYNVVRQDSLRRASLSISMFIVAFFLFFFQAGEALGASQTFRIEGKNRYLTAVEISKKGWPEGSDVVVLANGINYPDALSAAPLAKKHNAPILLSPGEKLNPDTAMEIKRLKAKRVILVGGDSALSTNVLFELRMMGLEVSRISGPNRYDTSLAVAQEVGMNQGVFVVRGDSYQDAVGASAIAAGQGMPLILVSNNLTPDQEKALGNKQVSSAIFVGGEKDFSTKIFNLFSEMIWIKGSDVYERNIELIKEFERGLDLRDVYVATGRAFPDALAASALAAQGDHPVFLINGNTIPRSVRNYFGEKVINRIHILGGTDRISESTRNTLASLPADYVDWRHLTVYIKERQSYQLPKTVTMKLNTGEWEEVPVDWGLASVSTNKAGTYYYEGKVDGYGYVSLTLVVEPIPTRVAPVTAEVVKGDSYYFPSYLPVTMSDGSVESYPIIWASNVVTMNKTGNYSFQGTVEGTTLKATVSLRVSEDSVIFPEGDVDSPLKKAVLNEINKTNSYKYIHQPIYKREVLQIRYLNASDYSSQITSLKELEHFTNLETLIIRNDALNGALDSTSLSSLQRLTNLRHLDLRGNKIEQITPLRNLTNLSYLDISHNKIKDFTPLKDLTRLRTLNLTANATLDYSPLRQIYYNLYAKDFDL